MSWQYRHFPRAVDRSGGPDACWPWTGRTNNGGYGYHREAYRLVRGEIPAGMHLDHLCRNRRCCNPWHLEAVSPRENFRRGEGNAGKTECDYGHDLTDDANVYQRPDRPGRVCRTCSKRRNEEVRQRHRDAIAWQQRERRRTGRTPRIGEYYQQTA